MLKERAAGSVDDKKIPKLKKKRRVLTRKSRNSFLKTCKNFVMFVILLEKTVMCECHFHIAFSNR